MGKASPAALRARLFGFVLLVLVLSLGAMLYSYWEARQYAALGAQDEALRLARLAILSQENAVKETQQLLRVLAAAPQVRSHDARACSAFMADLLKGFPRYVNVGAIKANGDVFCSALHLGAQVNVADAAYFRRAIEAREFAIGDYQIGRLTGKPTVNFAYPLLDAADRVQVVVFAALDLGWLNQVAARAQLPQGSTFTVFDSTGLVMARHPYPERWVGKSRPDSAIIKAIRVEKGEATAEYPDLDGVARVFAIARLTRTEGGGSLLVSIGIPREVVFSAVNRSLALSLGGLGLVGVLAFGAAWIAAARWAAEAEAPES